MIVPLLLFAALLPANTPPAKFVISGTVVREQSGQPIKHALVTITQNEHPGRNASLFTAADGRFTFTDVPQGKYTLQAQVHGEQRTFEQDGPYSTGIVTGPELDSEHIVFRFPLSASLLLKVQDEEGEPVGGAQVTLFARCIEDGWPRIRFQQQNGTDSDGSVRIAHLEPGTYYVAVMGRPWYAQNMPEPQSPQQQAETASLDVAYPLMYYPSAQNPEAAAPITLAPGDKTQLQMTVRAVPAIRISLDGVPGSSEPERGTRVLSSVEAIGPGGIRFQVPSYGYQKQDGAREIRGLAPGNYVVALSTFGAGSGRPEPLGTAKISGSGDMQLDASNLPRTAVGGHITVEPGGSAAGAVLVLLDPYNNQTALCRVGSGGSFRCGEGRGLGGNIAPGFYQVLLLNSPDLYIKSVTAQGGRYTGGLLDVREGQSAELTISAAKGRVSLNGIALRDGKPVSGAMVLLVPRDAATGIGIPRDQSDSDGTFTLRDAHPGHYYLVAIDHGRDLAYHDPRVLAPYLAGAEKIDIPLAANDRVHANVQTRKP